MQDALIEQSFNISVTALLEYLDLHACFMLQVGILAGDYPSSFYVLQWWNSHKPFLLQWAATAKSILAVQPSSAAVQRVFSLVNS